MRGFAGALLAAALVPLASGCGGSGAERPSSPPAAKVPTVLHRAGRQALPYREPYAMEKAELLATINAERAKAGAPPLAYSPRAAKAGDLYCLDAATRGSVGHWDLDGRPPYLRFALAGGVDAHAENFASQSQQPGPLTTPVRELLQAAHARFMAERPPDDGHRRTVLDPQWTHVGVGAALVGGEFRMTEEFVREVLEWVEVPAGPLLAGAFAPFGAKLPPGWNVGGVEVSYEPAPGPISRAEAARRGAYGYPETVLRLRPTPPVGTRYPEGDRGAFSVSASGTFRLLVPLASGPGSYYVHVYAAQGPAFGVRLTSVSAARIEAR